VSFLIASTAAIKRDGQNLDLDVTLHRPSIGLAGPPCTLPIRRSMVDSTTPRVVAKG
jgi:hypothetical protein